MGGIGRIVLFLMLIWFIQEAELQALLTPGGTPGNHAAESGDLGAGLGNQAGPAVLTATVPAGSGLSSMPGANHPPVAPARGYPLLAQNSNGSDVAASADESADQGSDDEEELDLEENGDDDFDDDLEDEFGDPDASEVYDPFSGYNRAMTTFNDTVYTWVLDPVARGYRWTVPEPPRRGIVNFFHNLLYPLRLVNNVLQVKFKNAGEETLRFVINTTVGILGFWDPARDWFGLERHDEDFGQTLGFYGVGSGPHIVLPFLGPSNLRDTFSLYPDYYLDPIRFVDGNLEQLGVRVFETVNDTSLHIGEYENLKKDAIDLYPFLRDVYEQNRNSKILE